jgi:hypothetical protein
VFDSFFRSKELGPTDRPVAQTMGQQDLDVVQPAVRSLLVSIQEAIDEALRNEKTNVSEHVDHPPFQFEFVDVSMANALASRFEDFSFIGITLPLVSMLWNACVRLSQSEAIGNKPPDQILRPSAKVSPTPRRLSSQDDHRDCFAVGLRAFTVDA